MKILLTTMKLDIGGAETHVTELARELKRRGHSVTVASSGGVYAAELERDGIPHHTVPMASHNPAQMLRAYFMLRKIAKRERPDIVHAHARIPAFLCGFLPRKRLGFHFVTTAHGAFRATGLLRLLSNWGERTASVSDDLTDYLSKYYGIAPQDVIPTVNGIDTDKFTPRDGVNGQGATIMHVSRLDPETALAARLLIELAPELARVHSGLKILIIGGGGAEAELRDLALAANERCGREVVSMTGARTDIAELLQTADLFVGVSRAALEALSCGVPTLLAGAQGFLGLFTPETEAQAVATNLTCRGNALPTAEALRAALEAALDLSGEPRERLASFGRDFVLRGYSVARMGDDAERLYTFENSRVSPRVSRVVMSGYFGYGNAGDEAILQAVHSAIESCASERVKLEITVLSRSPQATREMYGFTAVSRFNVLRVVRVLRRGDILVFGGGSLLQDQTSTRSLLYYVNIIRLAKLLGARVILYANGIGPVTRPANRRRVARVVSRADVITLRDGVSARELRDMGVKNELIVTSDPVFATRPPDVTQRAASYLPSSPYVAVSIRESRENPDFPARVARLCDRIAAEQHREILLVPMQHPADLAVSREVARLMTQPCSVLETRLSPSQLMEVFARADFAVAMRLHALIFSARAGTPAYGIDYDPKVAAYLDLLHLPCLGTPATLDPEQPLEPPSDELRAKLAEAVRQQAELAAATAKLLGKLIADGERWSDNV
ncbi:MAG: polysaccharide pyruvyl transferase CsaB [Oscillospiraceae bacterium]|jgi:polysaccharide pyruvyl transferase CsaB|nr:polysaccharide pyruvyl transferase CsaB [Oscillospiraceae bacterium]